MPTEFFDTAKIINIFIEFIDQWPILSSINIVLCHTPVRMQIAQKIKINVSRQGNLLLLVP